MRVTWIEAGSYAVSRWSGGTTTQLAICPPDALYADRDFLWRVSSAIVELPESDFTPLPDYDRILMILEGELSLSHDGGEEYVLRPLEQTSFDGASRTFSRGQVTDFNLMMRKGRCTGRVEARTMENEKWRGMLRQEYDSHLLYCVEGEAEVSFGETAYHIAKGESLLIEDVAEETCVIMGRAAVVLAEMKTQ